MTAQTYPGNLRFAMQADLPPYERLGFHRTGERTQDGVTLTVMRLDLVDAVGIDVLRESG